MAVAATPAAASDSAALPALLGDDAKMTEEVVYSLGPGKWSISEDDGEDEEGAQD